MATVGSSPKFALDIQPLFRASDREAMRFAFDLWDYHDVCMYAEDILDRLTDGTMPCDGEWSEEQIALFNCWVEAGMPV